MSRVQEYSISSYLWLVENWLTCWNDVKQLEVIREINGTEYHVLSIIVVLPIKFSKVPTSRSNNDILVNFFVSVDLRKYLLLQKYINISLSKKDPWRTKGLNVSFLRACICTYKESVKKEMSYSMSHPSKYKWNRVTVKIITNKKLKKRKNETTRKREKETSNRCSKA